MPTRLSDWLHASSPIVALCLALAVATLLASLPWGFLASLAILMWAAADLLQRRDPYLRNVPVFGRILRVANRARRTSSTRPFDDKTVALVRDRSRGQDPLVGFGEQPTAPFTFLPAVQSAETEIELRHVIGPGCTQPYSASIFNIAALSYGALSSNSIQALSSAARLGSFYCNTGEAGIARCHRQGGGDLVWQLGTAYFGARNADGSFSPVRFAEKATDPQVRAIEIKLSQGAKPGLGAILPGNKVSPSIAESCEIPAGVDSICPSRHTAFSTPIELMEFIAELRDLSGGKPVGFKLCVGHPAGVLSLCKAMRETGLKPDFISVDGSEGGGGAMPQEFAAFVGIPMLNAVTLVDSILRATALRQDITLIASGRIASAADIVRAQIAGADICTAARAFLLAMGCVQCGGCATNLCSIGIATQNRLLERAIHVPTQADRLAAFHERTVGTVADLMAAMGTPSSLRHDRVLQIDRQTGETSGPLWSPSEWHLDDGALNRGQLEALPAHWRRWWDTAQANQFC